MAADCSNALFSKRKRVVLSLRNKLKILERLNKGELPSSIAPDFNIGLSTIYDIRKNSSAFITYVSSHKFSGNRKSLKKAENSKLEEVLYSWYLEQKSLGYHISGSMLCEEAQKVNKGIEKNPHFKASAGWLRNFKIRYGIKLRSDLSGASSSSDEDLSRIIKSEYPDIDISSNDNLSLFDLEKNCSVEELSTDKGTCCKDDDNTEFIKLADDSPIICKMDKAERQPCEIQIKESKIFPSNIEAYYAFEIALSWLEHQPECDPTNLIMLEGLRDLAEAKALLKNKTNSDR